MDFDSRYIIAGVAVILVVAGAGFVLMGGNNGTNYNQENPASATGSQTGNTQSTPQQGQQSEPAVEVVTGVTPDRTVQATNYEFSQSSISVQPGTVIRFVNQQGTHTVTLETAGIDKTISGSDSVTLRFNEGGTFQVYCKFHGSPGSGMHTDVTVSS